MKIDWTGVTGITVFAPDGYSSDYSLEDIKAAFPQSVYYDAPLEFAGSDLALLEKPAAVSPRYRKRRADPRGAVAPAGLRTGGTAPRCLGL